MDESRSLTGRYQNFRCVVDTRGEERVRGTEERGIEL